MKVWLVHVPFNADTLTDQLYEAALLCIDERSRARVRRFYHGEDRWRCLIGRVLPRVLLTDRGILSNDIQIGSTASGKPFIESPVLDPPLSFNVTHDSGCVAMAFDDGAQDEKIGMDLMRVHIPPGETVTSFVGIMSDQLTQRERLHLASLRDPSGAAEGLFKYWTLKEAYTKALGFGLGLDFSRIEYNVDHTGIVDGGDVLVDGAPLSGWEFHGFHFTKGPDRYLGMVAKSTSQSGVKVSWTDLSGCDWAEEVSALDILGRAIPFA
ncbi:copper chaperone of lysine biosynthesis protein [Tulasnella sp. JGI-2019a]|nr:copper chaperone of lysine biosynthesis protein [Tulasnella sp. JGI-2019a]